ncbi:MULTISPECIES: hypothetical protein [Campylobacter]|uniref:hypothetical protein n=1 Tax=Campylobacter TaxID=194 RepID=UPI000A34AD44|nr:MULTISPECIES: hypothetical protein [unclassified Campylobacter]MCR8679670.1 hypothetical protein [Campylobacter sp. RM19072]MEE3777404.1 hypothetical protein [Campylobacter sp. CX2-4080-23]
MIKNAKINIDSSLAYAKVFGNDKNNIFNLSKKIDSLDKSIHILKQSNIEIKEYTNYLKLLQSKKEFLSDLIGKKIEKIVKDKSNDIDKDSFIYKEYKKVLDLLAKDSVIKVRENFSYSKAIEDKTNDKEIYFGR